MKRRSLKKILFTKTYKYVLGSVTIKSDIPLDEEQTTAIINIIKKVMDVAPYAAGDGIAREICLRIGNPIKIVATKWTSKKFFARLRIE